MLMRGAGTQGQGTGDNRAARHALGAGEHG